MVNRNHFATMESPGHHRRQKALLVPTSRRLPSEVRAKREAELRQSFAGRKYERGEAHPPSC